jgi:hypothetical protein
MGSFRHGSAELLERSRDEYERLEEKLWGNLAFRDYLAGRRSGLCLNADGRLANDVDFVRWQALEQLLGQVGRDLHNRTLC